MKNEKLATLSVLENVFHRCAQNLGPMWKCLTLFLLSHQKKLPQSITVMYFLIKAPVERWWCSHGQGTFPKDLQSGPKAGSWRIIQTWPWSVMLLTLCLCAFVHGPLHKQPACLVVSYCHLPSLTCSSSWEKQTGTFKRTELFAGIQGTEIDQKRFIQESQQSDKTYTVIHQDGVLAKE